jgi:hypothetical protein
MKVLQSRLFAKTVKRLHKLEKIYWMMRLKN